MKAAILTSSGEIRYAEMAEPETKPGAVKVRVRACGICGSDVPRVLYNGAHFYPLVLGHEFAGDVVEVGTGVSLSESFDVAETLEIEVSGAIRLLRSPALMAKVRCGGIYVDGTLCAFTLGAWNSREHMAVIEIEKAMPGMDGLYQLINREFLLHAFPEAELVNREDDVGIPGLRQAKLSYNPIAFEKRFHLAQRNF